MTNKPETSNKNWLERLNDASKVINLGVAAVGAVFGFGALVALGVGGYIVDKTIGDPIIKKSSNKQG